MKHIYTLLLITLTYGAHAQNLQIQNLSSNWGFDYDAETGLISNVTFNPAEGDGTDVDDDFVVAWGVQSDPNDPGSYTELDRQTITQGLPAFNAITVDNWSSQNLNDFDLPAGSYLVVAVVDADDDISETDESDNALFLATSADDAFDFTPGGGTVVNEQNLNTSLQAYPVPAVNTIHLDIDAAWFNATWQVINASGESVLSDIHDESSRLSIDVSDLSAGRYMVVLDQNGRRAKADFLK